MGAALWSSRAHEISDAAPAKTLVKQPQTATTPSALGAPRPNQSSFKEAVITPGQEVAAGMPPPRARTNVDSAGPARGRDDAATIVYPGDSPSKSTAAPWGRVEESARSPVPVAEPQPARPPEAPEAKPKIITVQPGTRFSVRLAETLATDRTRTGNAFRATLASPILINGVVVAESGATVLGRVVNARKAPLLHGRADLSLTISSIETRDNGLLRISTETWEQKGAHSNVVNAAKRATGAAVGAVVGAVAGAAEGAGLISGDPNRDRTEGFMASKRRVALRAGTAIIFVVAAPFSVTERVESR
jgi:hypothetical protein